MENETADLVEKLENYKKMRAELDEKKEQLKELQSEVASLEYEIIQEMEGLNLLSLRTDDGVLFTTIVKSYPSLKAEDREIAYNWLKERGLFDALATINPNTLRGFINERLEAGEELPPGVELYMKTTLSMRKG